MQVIHSGVTYECNVAIKCENDKYIKLYDANGAEIASFHNISDFSEYEISGGSFTAPCGCKTPIALTTYAIGGETIGINDWILTSDSTKYYYEIESNLISGNSKTCDILLLFAQGTDFEYESTQDDGKITLYVDAAPLDDIVINSIHVTRT